MRAPTTAPLAAVERDLLADDGRQVRVEGEHELLDLPAQRSRLQLRGAFAGSVGS